MANENETHEEVCAEMRSFGNVPPPMFAWRDLAERAEAAHKRELAVRDGERKGILKANAAFAADNTRLCEELAAKNTFIERLKSCLAGDCERMRLGAEPCENCHIERINERNEIIKELADALDMYLRGECIDCGAKCEGDGACVHQKNHRALVAKAREVVQ